MKNKKFWIIAFVCVVMLVLIRLTTKKDKQPFPPFVHVACDLQQDENGDWYYPEEKEHKTDANNSEEIITEKEIDSNTSLSEKEIDQTTPETKKIMVPAIEIIADAEEGSASSLFQIPGSPVFDGVFSSYGQVFNLLESDPKVEQSVPRKYKATVIKVVDGDTIVVLRRGKKEERIRLAGIDAPETKQRYGKEAKEYLSNLIFNQIITIENKGIDPYDRVVGIVYLGNVNINKNLVENGYVWFWKDYSYGLDYQQDQNKAFEDKKGLWQDGNAIPPWLFRKLESTGSFGKTVMAGGFYLDSRGILHNSRCNQYPKYRWDGVSKHPNCQLCGGAIFD